METWTRLLCLMPTRIVLRSISLSSAVHQKQQQIVIVGGGTGGCAVASRLAKHSSPPRAVTVIDPSDQHYYQALWTLVGAGIKKLSDSVKPMKAVLPGSVNFIQDKVVQLKPDKSSIVLAGGKELSYDYLVLALGMELHYDMIPGAEEALAADPRVCSNYSTAYVNKTFPAYEAFKGGNAVFSLPSGPIKCAGAPQKVMYLFEDYLKKHGRRDSAQLHYFTSLPKMFSVDKYATALAGICQQRGIHYNLLHHLVKVDHTKSEATFENITTKEKRTIKYDFLHITPPMTVPSVLKSTPKLGNPDMGNYVHVNTATLQHVEYANIFSLGDCAAVPTSKTAAAVSAQSSVLAQNLEDLLAGGKGAAATYDGYTACPLVTGYDRGIMAEFDYTNQPLETFPLDQGKERYLFYFTKVKLLPPIYWTGLVKGTWPGPRLVRKLLHLGMSR